VPPRRCMVLTMYCGRLMRNLIIVEFSSIDNYVSYKDGDVA
jgi:hypothetical protein